jgi:hypothetical protein
MEQDGRRPAGGRLIAGLGCEEAGGRRAVMRRRGSERERGKTKVTVSKNSRRRGVEIWAVERVRRGRGRQGGLLGSWLS